MKRLFIKILLLLFLLHNLSAQQNLLNTVIELKKDSYSLKELFIELQETHSIPLSYGNLTSSSRITFQKKTLSVQEVLDLALKNRPLTYQERKGKILIIPKKVNDNRSGRSTISGFILDAETGEALIGATIFDKISGSGVIANGYGFFSLTLISGQANIHVSYLGFEVKTSQLNLTEDETLIFELTPATGVLDEVTIVGSTLESIDLTPQMSMITLSAKQIENVPMVLGEHDVLKALQLLPGISGGTEGSSGIYVRGGGPDQNLILIDGVPVYNTSHMFGFFSVFNGDAINQVSVIKGGFPARYGGRLSSVIDISMKEGNNKEITGKATAGLISSKFSIEGPIKNENTSFILSGRRTYLDLLAIPFDVTDKINYYFYDFNAKVNHRFSDRDRIFLSFYGGNDTFFSSVEDTYYTSSLRITDNIDSGLKWGNIVSVLRWNHVFSPKLFGTFSTNFSRFRFNTSDERFSSATEKIESLNYISGVRDFSFKAAFEYLPVPEYQIRFGTSAIAHRFNTGVIDLASEQNNIKPSGRERIEAMEYAMYIENDFSVGQRLRFNMGAHASLFNVDDVNYFSLQPRLSGRLLLENRLSLKASYSEMRQFIHLLTNSGVGLPTDLWVPTTESVKPQFSRQLALGAAKVHDQFEISLEGYYKEMENLIEYENGASYLSADNDWENKVEAGIGTSYGVEFLIQKNVGKLTGWVGYTLSKSTRQFEELNFGKEFFYKYDRRHDVSATGTYHYNDNWKFSGNWVFGTGNAVTLPTTKYWASGYANSSGYGAGYQIWDLFQRTFHRQIQNFDHRNSYRIRDYHRMDISFSHSKKKKRGTRTWTFGVYNVYNRLNAFFVYVDSEYKEFPVGDDGVRIYNLPVLKQRTFLPAIPFINYSFKF